MKTKRRPKFLKKLKLTNPFPFPKAAWPDEKEVLKGVEFVMTPKQTRHAEKSREDSSIVEVELKTLASIATYTWKAKSRLEDAGGVEQSDVLKRVSGDIGRIWKVLVDDLGLEIKGHTGDFFDYGLPLKVVTTQPTADITKERVVETIKPTIRWRNKRIQMGEVVIATPA